jgi:hypothetical protein
MNNLKEVTFWLSLLIIFLILVGTTTIRFNFPELTETQLFLKFWWVFIPLVVCAIGLNWGLGSEK